MALIFSASSDVNSFAHSSRIIGPLLHWLFPQMSDDTMHFIVLLVRKCAHSAEYAVFGLLLWRALRKPIKNDPRPWCWREARLALLIVALYAASDEFHQCFVQARTALVSDVMVDTAGGAAGLLALWAFGHRQKRW
jgi:VanZ family protein